MEIIGKFYDIYMVTMTCDESAGTLLSLKLYCESTAVRTYVDPISSCFKYLSDVFVALSNMYCDQFLK